MKTRKRASSGALGFASLRILLRHIFPNLFNTVIVTSSLEVARMILMESILSFLGLGVQPPTPSWGGMLGEGRTYMLTHWWLATFPGIAIFFLPIMAFLAAWRFKCIGLG